MAAQPLRWVTQAVKARAKPVSAEEWEEHRDELCQLYHTMPLQAVEAYMRETHGFAPTRKQLISQFKKWGIRKYAQSEKAPTPNTDHDFGANNNPLPTSSHTTRSITHTPCSPYVESGPSKRSLPSSFTSQSVHGVDQRPRKMSKQFEISLLSPLLLSLSKGEPDEERKIRISKESVAYTLDRPKPNPGITGDFEDWAKEQGPFSENAVWHTVHVSSDASRALDTFSKSDIRDMKCAADYLFAIEDRRDAFALYAMILKVLKSSSRCPRWMLQWLVLACASTASEPPQLEITAALLRNMLAELGDHGGLPETFVINKLLERTTSRITDVIHEAPDELAVSSPVDDSLIRQLPTDYRSLDLWAYVLMVCDDLEAGRPSEWPLVGDSQLRIRNSLISRKPGPFEIEGDGVMANPCLRSCLGWCLVVLAQSRVEIDDGEWDERIQATRLRARRMRVSGCAPEASFVFTWLWTEWRTGRSDTAAQFSIWTTKSEELMGISACHTLSTVVRMCMGAANGKDARYSPRLDGLDITASEALDCAADGAAILSTMEDAVVACTFLDAFAGTVVDVRSTLPASERYRSYRMPPLYIQNYRSEPRQSSEDTMQTDATPTETIKPAKKSHLGSTRNRGEDSLSPPLAPSLRSSERSLSLRQMKALRDRLARKAHDRGVDVKPPSSVFGRNSVVTYAPTSVSCLSDSFETTLSLETRQDVEIPL